MHTERSDRPLLLREIGRTTCFRIIYPTLLATYIYNIRSLTIPSIWCQLPHGILRLNLWRGQERIPPIPLELLLCDHVVGAHPASARSKSKKMVNTCVWMKLNTNDGNKIQLWIFLLTHLILFFQSSPAHRYGSGWTRKCSIHSNYSRVAATTTLQEIEVNQTDKQEC